MAGGGCGCWVTPQQKLNRPPVIGLIDTMKVLRLCLGYYYYTCIRRNRLLIDRMNTRNNNESYYMIHIIIPGRRYVYRWKGASFTSSIRASAQLLSININSRS